MTEPKDNDEPTMDEILSSIRRIIAEEEPAENAETLKDVTDPYPDIPSSEVLDLENEDPVPEIPEISREQAPAPSADVPPQDQGERTFDSFGNDDDAFELKSIFDDDENDDDNTDEQPSASGPAPSAETHVQERAVQEDVRDDVVKEIAPAADHEDPFAELVNDESLTNALKKAGFDFSESDASTDAADIDRRHAEQRFADEIIESQATTAPDTSDDLDSILDELGRDDTSSAKDDASEESEATPPVLQPLAAPVASKPAQASIPASGPQAPATIERKKTSSTHSGRVSGSRPKTENTPAKAIIKDKIMPTTRQSGSIMSDKTEGATRSALGRLQDTIAPERHGSDVPSGTIESFVADMMRPMLKDWMDQNLPPIVERIVEREIGKMVKRAEID